jgi:alpha-1,2-mannosyltransferase
LLARKLVGAKHLWLLLLAPGAAVNLFVGQNGLLSTALMGGGVLMLGRRPIVGGALLGLMTYKPQFALLVPLVLICGREWRALASAVVSGAALALLAAAVLGVDPWLAFLHKAAQPAAIFSSSSSDWRSIPSVMIMARSLGLGAGLSAAIHWCVAIAAAIGALWIWRRTSDLRIRAGALAAATLLVTPYLRAYDLVLLILPIAVLLTNAEGKLGLGEMIAVFAAWVLPAVLLFSSPPVQLGPVVSVALMGLMLWQVARPKTIGHGIDGALGSRPRETQPASSS